MLSPNETSPTENSTSQSTMTSANFERDMEGNTGSALLEESNNNDEESTNNENAEDDKLYSDLTGKNFYNFVLCYYIFFSLF
jgi:hypothetical protein